MHCTGIDKNSGALKLQKEQEIAKERRKKNKKEKKEKREKSKNKYGNFKHREQGHKKRKYDEMNELQTKDPNKKTHHNKKTAAKYAIEQLEKSGLTDEHGLSCPTQEPCESFESTQNSSKSRKLKAPNVSGGSHGCTILRFMLPLQKHKEPKTTVTLPLQEHKNMRAALVFEEPCSSDRATFKDLKANSITGEMCFLDGVISEDLKGTPVANKPCFSDQAISSYLKATPANEEPCFSGQVISSSLEAPPGNEDPCSSGRTASRDLEATSANEGLPCFSVRATDAPLCDNNAHSLSTRNSNKSEVPLQWGLGESAHRRSSVRSKCGKRTRELERQFRNLILGWKPVPLLLDAEAGIDGLGWLFESLRPHHTQSCSVSNSIGEDQIHGMNSFQPRACYLPQFETYQLPYAVPF